MERHCALSELSNCSPSLTARSKVILTIFFFSFCSHFAESLPDLGSRQKKNS